MAAGTWKVFTQAKRAIGGGTLVLSGVFKMCLCSTGASANLLKNTNTGISTWASVGSEITAQGGYAANGRSIPAIKWTVDTTSSAKMKFSYTTSGLVFTASGASLASVHYAVIRNSVSANGGLVLCFCTLSTAAFTITSPNTLTILPATGGVFSLK